MNIDTTPVDLSGMLFISIIACIVAAIGHAIDTFLLPKERSAVRRTMIRWWGKVERLRLPDLPAEVARAFLGIKSRLLGDRVISIRWWSTSLILSIGMTAIGLWAGDAMWARNIDYPTSRLYSEPRLAVYPLNFFFDVVTITITVRVMALIVENPGMLKRIVLVSGDIVLALLLAYFVYVGTNSVQYWGDGASSIEPTGIQTEYLRMDSRGYLSFWERIGLFNWDWEWLAGARQWSDGWIAPHVSISRDDYAWNGASAFFTANTTFVPTAIYMALTLALSISMLVLTVIKKLAMRLFELDIQTEKSVFFYTGVLVGVLSVVTKGFVELYKVL